MSFNELKIDAGGGQLELSVLIGQAQLGVYRTTVYDKDGKNPSVAGEGNNYDRKPDTFPLGPAAQLVDGVVTWDIRIGAPNAGPGQNFFASVAITQGGTNVADGPFEYSGQFEDAKFILDGAKFVAA